MSRSPPADDDDDTLLFRKTVGKVRPVAHDRVRHQHKRPPPKPRFTEADERAVIDELLEHDPEPGDLESGEELSFAREGIQHATLRKLRRGQYVIHDELDMHGMTVAMARPAVIEFLRAAQLANRRCVRIVHGKGRGSKSGQPVLKNKLNLWLRRSDAVLAFCSARLADGGTGAVYVLLKRVK